MTDVSTQINLSDSNHYLPVATNVGVRLEQVNKDESQQTVTMYDIQQMVARARAGLSALTYKPADCPAYIAGNQVLAYFDFWAWPSSASLDYNVTVSFGELTDKQIISSGFEESFTFGMTDNVSFSFMVTDIYDVTWETSCYNNKGEVVDCPELELESPFVLRSPYPIFGVARVRGRKRGDLYRIHAALKDFKENRITNLTITAMASWDENGEKKSHSITMSIPQCLKDLIDSCWIDTDGDGIPDSPPGDYLGYNWFLDICGAEASKPPMNVYVSICSGEELRAVRADSDESKANWCGKR